MYQSNITKSNYQTQASMFQLYREYMQMNILLLHASQQLKIYAVSIRSFQQKMYLAAGNQANGNIAVPVLMEYVPAGHSWQLLAPGRD